MPFASPRFKPRVLPLFACWFLVAGVGSGAWARLTQPEAPTQVTPAPDAPITIDVPVPQVVPQPDTLPDQLSDPELSEEPEEGYPDAQMLAGMFETFERRLRHVAMACRLDAGRAASGKPEPGRSGSKTSILVVRIPDLEGNAQAIRVEFPQLTVDASEGRLIAWHPKDLSRVFVLERRDATPEELIADVLPPLLCPPLAFAEAGSVNASPLLHAQDAPRVQAWTVDEAQTDLAREEDPDVFFVLRGDFVPTPASGASAARFRIERSGSFSYVLLDQAGIPSVSVDFEFLKDPFPQARRQHFPPDDTARVTSLGQLRGPVVPVRRDDPLPRVAYVGLSPGTTGITETRADPLAVFADPESDERSPDLLVLFSFRPSETETGLPEITDEVREAVVLARREIARVTASLNIPASRKPRFIVRPLALINQAQDATDTPRRLADAWSETNYDQYLADREIMLPDFVWTPAFEAFQAEPMLLIVTPEGRVVEQIDPRTNTARRVATDLARAIAPELMARPIPALP